MHALRTIVVVLLPSMLLAGCLGSSGPTPATPAPSIPLPVTPPDPFAVKVAELDAHLSPIANADPLSSLDDLAPLAAIAQARFVGLGEATHGTREFFHLKHKILRYLVENHGFRVFAIEADMAESVYIDRYVAGIDDANLTTLMRQRMHFWTWLTAEVRDQIDWMREYNAGRPDAERLLYVGIDCQLGNWYPDLITDYVAATHPESLATAEAAVGPLRFAPTENANFYGNITAAEYHAIADALDGLIDLFDANEAGLTAATTAMDFRLHRRLVTNLRTIHESIYLWYQGNQQESSRRRERCMADNVMWVEELVGTPVGTAIWAHNMHIGADVLPGGGYMMGGHLRNALGQQYRAVGFSFTRGTVTAVGPDGLSTYTHRQAPAAGSVTELLHAAGTPDYILDMSALPPESELRAWLTDVWRQKLTIGAVYDPPNVQLYIPVRAGHHFDVMIHIDDTTHSVLINR